MVAVATAGWAMTCACTICGCACVITCICICGCLCCGMSSAGIIDNHTHNTRQTGRLAEGERVCG